MDADRIRATYRGFRRARLSLRINYETEGVIKIHDQGIFLCVLYSPINHDSKNLAISTGEPSLSIPRNVDTDRGTSGGRLRASHMFFYD